MAYSNGKITAPVSTDDVCAALGISSHDVATLCSSSEINPAARCKPVRGGTPASLTDAQRRGAPALDGCVWGVKMVVSGVLSDVHSLDFAYQRVRPGTDWCRLDDFVGYDHNAVFSPQGTITAETFTDSGEGLPVRIERNALNTTGVSVEDYMTEQGTDGDLQLAAMYPCIMLSRGDTHYIRALANWSVTTGSRYTPMTRDGVWNEGWVAETRNYSENPDMPATAVRTFLTSEGEFTATVFFVKSLAPEGDIDLMMWNRIDSLSVAFRVYGCPGATARAITFKASTSKGYAVTAVSLELDAEGELYCYPTLTELSPVVGQQYTLSISMQKASGELTLEFDSVTLFKLSDARPSIVPPLRCNNAIGLTALDLRGSWSYQWTITSGGTTVNTSQGTYTNN